MIKLDLDLLYITKKYGISAKQIITQSEGNSISEIMEEEADNGNVKAANFEREVLKDKEELMEAFKLADPTNRYLILMSLDKSELNIFLVHMKPQDLAIGLRFFTKEKIISMMKQIPQEMLFAMLKEIFPTEKIMSLIPEKELNKFLSSDKLEPSAIKKHLEDLPPRALAQIIEATTGKACKTQDKDSMLSNLRNTEPHQLVEGILSMDAEYKAILCATLIDDDKSLIKNFSSKALTQPFNKMEKYDVIKSLGTGVDVEHLVPMVEELPKELLSMVTTQLDVDVFAEILIQEYQDILAQVALS